MTYYMSLWQKIRGLSDSELDTRLAFIQPAEGVLIDFFGLKVVDIDVIEALCFIRDERARDPKPVLLEADMANLVHPFID